MRDQLKGFPQMRPGLGRSAGKNVEPGQDHQAVSLVINGARLPGLGQQVRAVLLRLRGLADLADLA